MSEKEVSWNQPRPEENEVEDEEEEFLDADVWDSKDVLAKIEHLAREFALAVTQHKDYPLSLVCARSEKPLSIVVCEVLHSALRVSVMILFCSVRQEKHAGLFFLSEISQLLVSVVDIPQSWHDNYQSHVMASSYYSTNLL